MTDSTLTLAQSDTLLTKLADRMHLLDGTELAGTDADQPVTFQMVGHDGGTYAAPHTPIIKVCDAEGNELTRFLLVSH